VEDSDGDGIGNDQDPEPYADNTPPAHDFGNCSPVYNDYPNNIVDNSDFEICMFDPWWFYIADYAGVSITNELTDGICVIRPQSIVEEDPQVWHIQLIQEMTAYQKSQLEVGATYLFSFEASAEADNHVCQVYFGQDEDPWTPLLNEWIDINTNTRLYEFEFTVTQIFSRMKISFNIGTNLSAVSIDNVKITKQITDSDDDYIADSDDNCPITYNPGQEDTDNDNVGDACDNCLNIANSNQADSDGNGIGDACESTGIEAEIPGPETLIFPNPSEGIVYLLFGDELNGKTTIEIRDISGGLVHEETVDAALVSVHSIDISGFKESIYFVRLCDENGCLVRKLVKAE
jgi:hypothetical protein